MNRGLQCEDYSVQNHRSSSGGELVEGSSIHLHEDVIIPMAYSMDGLAGKEVRAAEKRLTSLLASKWNRPYSEMACFVKTRTGVAIHVRSISMLLRGCWSSTWKRRAPDGGVAARATVTSQRW